MSIMMKKRYLFILSFFLMAFLVTCGSESSDEVPVEKSIDGVAAYMGYSDGEEIDLSKNEEMSGALKGKYFEDGKVSIYEFDPNSSYYEFWENETDTCVGGFLLLYDFDADDEKTDYEVWMEMEKIERIKFIDEQPSDLFDDNGWDYLCLDNPAVVGKEI